MKKNTVCVYDTISKSYVEVEVSCEVYTQYNRTKLAIENKTERECAEILCTSQQNVHKKKRKILCKLNKLLEKE